MGINQPGAGKQGGLGRAGEHGPLRRAAGWLRDFQFIYSAGVCPACSACEMFALKDPAVRWVKNILLSQELAEILVNLQKYVFVGAAYSVRRTSINYSSRKPFSWNKVLSVFRALSGWLCWEWSFAGKCQHWGGPKGQTQSSCPVPHRQTPHQEPAQIKISVILNCKQNINLFSCLLKACLPCCASPPGCGWTFPSGVSTTSLTVGMCPHPVSLSTA